MYRKKNAKVNVKGFYLLLYLIAHKTLSLLSLKWYTIFTSIFVLPLASPKLNSTNYTNVFLVE